MKLLGNFNPYKRRIITATLMALTLIIVLITTPYIIQSQITKLLLELGAQDASVTDVNLNPFSGVMEITELRFSSSKASDQQLSKLSVNVRLLSLFNKRIHFENMAVDGVNLSVEIEESGKLIIGGIVIPEATDSSDRKGKQSKPWGIGIDSLALSQINIDYRDPKLENQLNLEQLQLVDLANWNRDQESPLKLKAKLNNDLIELDGKALPFAKDPTFSGKAILQKIELKPFAPLVPQLKNLTGQISIDSTIALVQHADSSIELTHTGEFKLEQLKLQSPDIELAQDKLLWNGTVGINIQEDQLHSSMDALLTLQGVKASAGERALAAFDTLSTTIQFDSLDSITLSENTINKIVLGESLYKPKSEKEPSQSLLTIAKISIPNISLSEMKQLQIDEVSVIDIVSTIRRNKEGVWIPVTLMEAIPQQAAVDEKSTVEDSDAEAVVTENLDEEVSTTSIKIGKFTLSGENHIHFDDRGVTPPYRADLAIKVIEIGLIDSTQPDNPSPLHMIATIDKYSEISVEGTITPFASKSTLELNNTIKALPLSTLSSYTVPLMGYNLKSGQLDADNRVKMGKGKIDGEIELTLNALEVESVVSEDSKARDSKNLDSQLSIPLGTALNMLRDKNRTIILTIPISGDSDKPDIDPSDVINTAIAKAMKKGAMSYLISSLQPYGALISLAQIAGEAAIKVRLEPIKFDAASSAIDTETSDYLPKVVKLMGDRPELNIKVCGVAVESDYQTLLAEATAAAKREALKKKLPKGQPAPKPAIPTISDEQLLELARARVITVKDQLITELKADATHLIDCQPLINREATDNPPRVELLI